MLLRETGFTFDGKHCMNDFGMMYSEGSGHPVIPAISRNEYEIAGVSGTVLMDGEVRSPMIFSGTLYPHRERESQAGAQALLRQVQQWLTAGRKKLIFDYEPDKYYLAQLTRQSAWSLKNWFGGELGISFQAEPWAYAVNETVWTQDITGEGTLDLRMVTGAPAPAVIRIENTSGSGDWQAGKFISAVSINDGQITLEGFTNWRRTYALEISCEPPINAWVYATMNDWSAMMRMTAFSPVRLSAGLNQLKISLTPGEDVETATARVTVRARGRW